MEVFFLFFQLQLWAIFFTFFCTELHRGADFVAQTWPSLHWIGCYGPPPQVAQGAMGGPAASLVMAHHPWAKKTAGDHRSLNRFVWLLNVGVLTQVILAFDPICKKSLILNLELMESTGGLTLGFCRDAQGMRLQSTGKRA